MEIHPITPKNESHYLGYYDRCHTSPDNTKVLVRDDKHTILIYPNKPYPSDLPIFRMCRTIASSFQQGAMAQWIDDCRIIYNTINEITKVIETVIVNIFTKQIERKFENPQYIIHNTTMQAAGLDFRRLALYRPGYGFNCPFHKLEKEAVWVYNLDTNKVTNLIPFADLHDFNTTHNHWINHIQFSPDGSKLAFLHRWKDKTTNNIAHKFKTALYTYEIKKQALRKVCEGQYLSHYDWFSNEDIVIFDKREHNKMVVDGNIVSEGEGFYFHHALYSTKSTQPFMWTPDGHFKMDKSGRYILLDNYPKNSKDITLNLYDMYRGMIERMHITTVKSKSGFKPSAERIDMHASWGSSERQIFFQSDYEGYSRVYRVDLW